MPGFASARLSRHRRPVLRAEGDRGVAWRDFRDLPISLARRIALPFAAFGLAVPALAAAPVDPAAPLREQAAVLDADLATRLDTIVPRLMREQGVDMWILVAREYLEDPVVSTMLDARSMRARRRTILVFFDPGRGKPVERITVSRYALAGLFKADWNPEAQPDQWKRLGEIVAARDPRRIALNVSSGTAFGDGLTKSQHDELVAALPPGAAARIVPGEELAVGWLETRSAGELARFPALVALSDRMIGEAFSAGVVKPGVTTAEDVQWWLRERIRSAGLDTWFHPSVSIFRRGRGELSGAEVIRPGDMLWTDFGLTQMRLNTDRQQLAYVLRPGETDAPAGLKAGMAAANRVQDMLIGQYRTGRSGNEMLAGALAEAWAAGIDATIYSHPLGFHGHAAGAAIGMWDDQQAAPRGAHRLRPDTAWSIELQATSVVAEWGGQRVPFRLEVDGWFDGSRFRWLAARQTRFHLIR